MKASRYVSTYDDILFHHRLYTIRIGTTGVTSPTVAGPSTSLEYRRITRSLTANKREHVPGSSGTPSENKNAKHAKNEANLSEEQEKKGEEISLEELVFSNYLVVREIFENLDFGDLKSSRQVSPLWNVEATAMIFKRFAIRPIMLTNKIAGVSNKNDDFTFDSNPARPVSLNVFCNLVSKSKIFPCYNYVLTDFPLGESLKRFFSTHGSLVKSLIYKKSKVRDIISLAANFLPNLEILTDVGWSFILTDVEQFDKNVAVNDNLELPKLHTFTMSSHSAASVISRLLNAAPNLRHMYLKPNASGVCTLGLEFLMRENAISRLSDIELIFFSEDSLNVFEKVMNENPRFERIRRIMFESENEFDVEDLPRVGKVLTKMFQQSSESLTHIYYTCCLGPIPDLKIPVLPKLKRLFIKFDKFKVYGADPFIGHALPAGTNAPEIFPNLKKLEVYCKRREELPKIFSDATIALLTVKTLVVFTDKYRTLPTSCVQQLCTLLPNLTSASFSNISDEAFEFVFNLRFLRTLELTLKTPFLALNSAITGFSQQSFTNLHEKRDKSSDLAAGEVEALRIKPCIVDLKELKQLFLKLEDRRLTVSDCEYDSAGNMVALIAADLSKGPRKEKRTIVSHVARRFGFDMCPRLGSNVTIILENKKTFSMQA